MREKLNNSPIAQAVLIGVLLVAVVLIFMMQMGGGGGDETPTTPAATAPPPTMPATGSSSGVPPAAPAVTVAGSLEPGPGLPKSVADAYERGRTVVFLVADDKPVDRTMVESVRRLSRQESGVTTFIFGADDIAKYSRLTIGLDVNRTPALVVYSQKPKDGASAPMVGDVSYGYRSDASIRQAVIDMRYDGDVTTHSPS